MGSSKEYVPKKKRVEKEWLYPLERATTNTFLKSSPEDMLINIREKGKEGKREGEKH